VISVKILRCRDYPETSGRNLNAITSVILRERQRETGTDRRGEPI
jgi:hypothetical protein